MAKAFFAIVDMLMILFAIPILLAELVLYAAHHAWAHVIGPRIRTVERVAAEAHAAAVGASGSAGKMAKASAAAVAAAVTAAETRAIHAARAYTDSLVRPLRTTVTALEKVALPDLVRKEARQAATITRLDTRIKALEQEVATLEATAGAVPIPIPIPRPTPAPAPIPIPVPGERGEPGTPGAQGAPGERGAPGEAATLPDIDLPGLGTLTLGAAVAATYSVVSTLVDEAGLGRAECRGKVKQICATDTSAWTHLLEGAAFLALALDFREFVKAAQVVADGIGHGVIALEGEFMKKAA